MIVVNFSSNATIDDNSITANAVNSIKSGLCILKHIKDLSILRGLWDVCGI